MFSLQHAQQKLAVFVANPSCLPCVERLAHDLLLLSCLCIVLFLESLRTFRNDRPSSSAAEFLPHPSFRPSPFDENHTLLLSRRQVRAAPMARGAATAGAVAMGLTRAIVQTRSRKSRGHHGGPRQQKETAIRRREKLRGPLQEHRNRQRSDRPKTQGLPVKTKALGGARRRDIFVGCAGSA